MKEEIAKKWVAALRSGKYKQGTGQLLKTSTNGLEYHCCLGVLCELVAVKDDYWKYDVVLPGAIATRVGMRTTSGELPGPQRGLSGRNDSGATFAVIADLIEQHWEKL